ncbi:MAG: hypothetical protein ACREFO_09745 [Acetobacteraceae bacterium]
MPSVLGTLLNHGAFVFAVVIIGVLVVAEDIGHRLGRWRAARREFQEREASTIGAITAGMLTLLAFALGLSVSIALERYNTRRDLVVEEANVIGTAWLDAGAIGAPEGSEVPKLLETWGRLRLAYTTLRQDQAAEDALLTRTNTLQSEIWQAFMRLVQRSPNPVTATLMQALTATFDAASAQRAAFANQVPRAIVWALIAGSVLSMGALGFQVATGGRRQLALALLLAVMWTGAMVLVTDLGEPRIGAIMPNPAPLEWTIQGFSGAVAPAR